MTRFDTDYRPKGVPYGQKWRKRSGAGPAVPKGPSETATHLAHRSGTIVSMKTIGYARVSTDDQTAALQLDALRAAGCTVIFDDAAGGTQRARPGLTAAIAAAGAGDAFVVWRLDRLGRSLRHLLEIVETLRDRGVVLRSLTEAVDTSTATGKLVYGILGSIAEFERELIQERTIAGMHAARRRGVHCGRRRALTPSQVDLARLALTVPGASIAHVARQLRVGRATLYRELGAEGTTQVE